MRRNHVERLPTFGAVVGGLSEQTLAVIGTFESPLDAPTESNVVLTLRGRDGETALLLHGQVWVRVWVLTWEKRGRTRQGKIERRKQKGKMLGGRRRRRKEMIDMMVVLFIFEWNKRNRGEEMECVTTAVCVFVSVCLPPSLWNMATSRSVAPVWTMFCSRVWRAKRFSLRGSKKRSDYTSTHTHIKYTHTSRHK